MKDWNANLYTKFERERTLPAKDLLSRIRLERPARLIDIGCGPGNSTRELMRRWPEAEVIGLDNSQNMLEKAKEELPAAKFILADAGGDLSILGKFDIIFSNAALQWIPGHISLLPKLMELLNSGGALAVQVPNTTKMAITAALDKTASAERWGKLFSGLTTKHSSNEPGDYYDALSPVAGDLSIWETRYYHVMADHSQIVEWYESTGLRPYLNVLDEGQQAKFKADLLQNVASYYPKQKDGTVLFPFRRIFLLAYRN